MRNDCLYLRDIIEAADAIATFLKACSEEQFISDDILKSAVLQKLTVIGEGAARLSQDIKNRYPSIPWADLVGFRNIAVHAYFSVEWSIVWVTATEDVPMLRGQVASLLEQIEGEQR